MIEYRAPEEPFEKPPVDISIFDLLVTYTQKSIESKIYEV